MYIVVFVMAVVGILAFSLNSFVSNISHQMLKHNKSVKVDMLLKSAVAWATGKIQEELEKPNSGLFRLFISDKLIPGLELAFDREYLYQMAKDSKIDLDVRVFVSEVAPLDIQALNENRCGFDQYQRVCRLKIAVRAVDTLSHEEAVIEEFRETKILNLLPGIFGKFSLFIKNAGDTDFNLFSNTINGWPDPADHNSVLPLVLYNGEELDIGISPSLECDTDESFARRGFIYLGNGQVKLNLTAGDDERYGESFHFFRPDQFAEGRSPRPIGYYPPSPPPFFTPCPPFVSTAHPQRNSSGDYLNPVPPFSPNFTYYLKHMIYGFFTSDSSGWNMNNEYQLYRTFPGSVPANCDSRMRSSCLHLFGTAICPSPTLVLGDVYRRYVDYSSIIMDATGVDNDGAVHRDAMIGYVSEIPDGYSLDARVFPNPVPAGKAADIPEGTPIQFPADVSWRKMFGPDSAYQGNQCRITEEPYLRSHDFICFRPDNGFFPSRSSFGASEATSQETFSLSLHPTLKRDRSFFQKGTLGELKYEDLAAKAVYKVRTFDEFLSRFVSTGATGELILNSVVQIVGVPEETYTLPPIRIARGGILLLDNGNLRISSIMRDEGRLTEVLTVALGKGNIILNTAKSGEDIHAFLMAFEGTVRNETPSYPLRLKGGLLEKNHSSQDFRSGGKIEYDAAADPSEITYPLYYRILISEVEPQKSPTSGEVEQ